MKTQVLKCYEILVRKGNESLDYNRGDWPCQVYALGGTEIVITQTLFGNEFLVNF